MALNRTKLLTNTAYSPDFPTTPRADVDGAIQEIADLLLVTTDGSSGGDNVGMTVIPELGSANTTQSQMEAAVKYAKDGLLANKNGDHLGTWQGYSPTATSPGIQSVVDGHTTQLTENTYYRGSQLIANTINKLNSGKNITIAGLGDSIMDGYYATGNYGYMDKLVALINAKYGVTTTLNNQGISGYTVRDSLISGSFDSVINSKPDLVIISFGHNDIKSDLPGYYPGWGYPIEQSMSDTEYIIRRLRSDNPSIDIILLGESPYAVDSVTSNLYLSKYTNEYKILASIYNCAMIDAAPLFTSIGDYSGYMYDAGHPNEAGHQLISEELIKYFLTVPIQNNRSQSIKSMSLRKIWRYGKQNWKQITGSIANDGNRVMYNGAGWSGTPKATSTATNYVDILARCNCIAIKIKITENTRLLIVRDSIPWFPDITLTSIYPIAPDSFWLTIPFDKSSVVVDDSGVHCARLYLRAGSIEIDEVWCLSSIDEFIPCDSPLVTYDANWVTTNNTDTYGFVYNTKFKAPTVDSGYTVTIPFIGTGLAMDCNVQSGTGILQVSIDGSSAIDLAVGINGAYNIAAGVTICKGLPYGQHTVQLVGKPGNTVRVRIGGFLVIDERRIEEARVQRGYCKVGSDQLFGTPYDSIPVINMNGNGVYPTTPSKNGFTVAGTDGQIGIWESIGDVISY